MRSSSDRKMIVILTLSILLISFTSGCLLDRDSGMNYTFKVKLSDIKKDSDVTVKIPFLGVGNESNQAVLDNIEVRSGKGDYEITSSKYGPALEINSKDSFKIVSKGEIEKGHTYFNFSMNNNKTKYWVYSDCNCTLNYYYKFAKSIFKVETELTEGWQSVKFEEIHYRD